MHLISDELEKYIETFSAKETDLLQRLNRETHLKIMMPQMLSGQVQGGVLAMLSYMIQPNYILEIGTFTGYSALCLAEGLKTNGKLITIDINNELEDMIKHYVEESGNKDKIDLRIGNALEIIPTLPDGIDLVFIDADKINYAHYFDLVIEKLRPGGFIIADNVLWSGRILDAKKDKDTQALHDYNQKVAADRRVENVIFGIRDGLNIARKIV